MMLITAIKRSDAPGGKPTRILMNSLVAMSDLPTVLNLEENWHLILPHLSHPQVMAALETCMNEYIASRKVECVRLGFLTKQWDIKYNPKIGPWEYAFPDGVDGNNIDNRRKTLEHNYAHEAYFWVDLANHFTNKAIEKGEFEWNVEGDEPTEEQRDQFGAFESQFYPAKGTPEWYLLPDYGSFWLAPWLRVLGEHVYPELTWNKVTSEKAGIAYGTDKKGKIKLILDLREEYECGELYLKFIWKHR